MMVKIVAHRGECLPTHRVLVVENEYWNSLTDAEKEEHLDDIAQGLLQEVDCSAAVEEE